MTDDQANNNRSTMLNKKLLLPFDKKNPEYRILTCNEEQFGDPLKISNIIANCRALFKYSEWFDRLLAQIYPNHFLLGNKVWMVMSNVRETRNLIFVARCLAVAANTDRMKEISECKNFNVALNAIEEWTKEKMETKALSTKSVTTVSRSTVRLTDPRGFALSMNHGFIDRMNEYSKLGIG